MDFIPCTYVGQKTSDGRRFDGLGRYTFSNGDVYLGGMRDGVFHGNGVIFFRSTGVSNGDTSAKKEADESNDLEAFLAQAGPAGAVSATSAKTREVSPRREWAGQYRGVWENGRHVEGCYVFADGLVYGSDADGHHRSNIHAGVSPSEVYRQQWTYCHGSDHRLWEEYLENVAPVLPHEALLGGAKLLHQRKEAVQPEAPAHGLEDVKSRKPSSGGEGVPMVLPNAFVQARAAPAFAAGQLTGITDRRVEQWTAAATAEAARVGVEASPDVVVTTIALELAIRVPTEELRVSGSSDVAENCTEGKAQEARAAVAEPGSSVEASKDASAQRLNLAVCRVRDVEDVKRTLVQVAAAPAPPAA